MTTTTTITMSSKSWLLLLLLAILALVETSWSEVLVVSAEEAKVDATDSSASKGGSRKASR